MKGTYEVADRRDRRAIAEFLKRGGQFLLPMVEGAELAIDEVIEVLGRATIEACAAAGSMPRGPSLASCNNPWFRADVGIRDD